LIEQRGASAHPSKLALHSGQLIAVIGEGALHEGFVVFDPRQHWRRLGTAACEAHGTSKGLPADGILRT
jgi:hypothetical protein